MIGDDIDTSRKDSVGQSYDVQTSVLSLSSREHLEHTTPLYQEKNMNIQKKEIIVELKEMNHHMPGEDTLQKALCRKYLRANLGRNPIQP